MLPPAITGGTVNLVNTRQDLIEPVVEKLIAAGASVEKNASGITISPASAAPPRRPAFSRSAPSGRTGSRRSR